jgi:hypothetical protein
VSLGNNCWLVSNSLSSIDRTSDFRDAAEHVFRPLHSNSVWNWPIPEFFQFPRLKEPAQRVKKEGIRKPFLLHNFYDIRNPYRETCSLLEGTGQIGKFSELTQVRFAFSIFLDDFVSVPTTRTGIVLIEEGLRG